MSAILCIIDGMTDPLFQVENYPALASMEQGGMVQTVPTGAAVESLTCILTLLGVKNIPANLRGYAEALGLGIAVDKEDLVLRGTWVQLDQQGFCVALADAPPEICPYPAVEYHCLGSYKSLLIFKGCGDALAQIRTFAPYACWGLPMEKLLPQGDESLLGLAKREIRGDRALIPWGQSRRSVLPPFPHSAAVVCSAAIMRGIALLLGMQLIVPPGASGETDTCLDAKLQATVAAAERYPVVVLHLNGADEAGHRGDAREKGDFITAVDEQVLLPLLQTKHHIYVISDHGTDPVTGKHIGGLQAWYQSKRYDHHDKSLV